ncbi:MAG TPA: SUMF1/EgtB/PvdO family nonheme iron enzyme [Opitutaceae bacterium]|nr:SUMF1/EgtB/PvdO family nonheme iron enzyme [Opitutaceae bacterium]
MRVRTKPPESFSRRGCASVRTTQAGAEVQEGAIALERSPLNLRDQRLGKYPVRVRLDGYEEWSGEIEVVENRFAELNVALVRSTGTVTLSTEPAGLDYVLRGEVTRSGRTPANLENLPTGRYEVTFTRPGWPEQKAAVDVMRNRTAAAQAGFLAGGIELNSVPGGAQVWAGGRQIGVTPLVLQEVLPGHYDYELRLAGHQSSAVALRVASRQTVRENIFLQRLPYPQSGEAHENTLGMKFLPVPGIGVLVSIWETRVQDFEAFVNATGHNATEGMFSVQAGSWKQKGDNWRTPGYTQGPAHPVVGINDEDIRAFCRWLTEKERREGRLAANQEYRLPTDAEWEAAAGPDTFPWGNQWPPPGSVGNYNGVEAPGTDWPSNWTPIAGYNDGYPRAAPVGSFPANRHGIYDLGGNVWERIGGRANGMRGAAFNSYDRSNLAVAYRHTDEGSRAFNVGFRIVCVVGAGR